MNLTTAPLSWHWSIIFLICVLGAISVRRASRFYPLFWWPLITLGGICTITFLKCLSVGPPASLRYLFVLPVLVVSLLGIMVGILCLRKRPLSGAANALPMSIGILSSIMAVLLTTRAEMQHITVYVLDGNGKPVSDVPVTGKVNDTESIGSIKPQKSVTDRSGSVHFKFWRFKSIEVSASNPGGYQSRAIYGEISHTIRRKAWVLLWDNQLSCRFSDQASDPKTVTLYLRGADELVLPEVTKHLAGSILKIRNQGNAEYALKYIGTNFENLELIGRAPLAELLGTAYGTFLYEHSKLVRKCFEVLDCERPKNERRFSRFNRASMSPSGWNALARWAGIEGDDISPTPENVKIVELFLLQQAGKLLDEAKPMLRAEHSTAAVYGELGFISTPRLDELSAAYVSADPMAKRSIYSVFSRDTRPLFSQIEPLLDDVTEYQALDLLSRIGGWKDQTEFNRARAFFSKLYSEHHSAPDTDQRYEAIRSFFREEEKRWTNTNENP